jgi:hypothetical protein
MCRDRTVIFLAGSSKRTMFEAYLLGCAVGLVLSSLSFGLVFDLGMFTAWITERPDTPRVVTAGPRG